MANLEKPGSLGNAAVSAHLPRGCWRLSMAYLYLAPPTCPFTLFKVRRFWPQGHGKPRILTCLPRFPGLPLGPRCPAIPGSPFGPISPCKEKREAREELGCAEQAHLCRSVNHWSQGQCTGSFQVFSKWEIRRVMRLWEWQTGFSRKERRGHPGQVINHLRWPLGSTHSVVPHTRMANAGGPASQAHMCLWCYKLSRKSTYSFTWNFVLCFVLFLAQIQIYGFLNDWTQFWQLPSLESFSHIIIIPQGYTYPHSSAKLVCVPAHFHLI